MFIKFTISGIQSSYTKLVKKQEKMAYRKELAAIEIPETKEFVKGGLKI